MANRIVVGMQWGDEGKGKVVDLLSRAADIIARYQGGANAGHTVVVGNEKFILHLIPSGILHPGKICVIGNGVVIDILQLLAEIEELSKRNISVRGRLFISGAAHLVLPYHKTLDLFEETQRGQKIGTTGRGIGPAYADKFSRWGIRLIDLWDEERLPRQVALNIQQKARLLELWNSKIDWNEDQIVTFLLDACKRLSDYVTDTSLYLHQAIRQKKSILFEGAQGTLLDVDFGTYPFATSSNSIAGGALTGLGLGPKVVDEVIGVMKAYTTRVGNGPFPTELTDQNGTILQERGNEFGATTGRARRCGWLDAVLLRYAVRVNGINKLAVMKLDVLDTLEEIKICVGYNYRGQRLDEFPQDMRTFAGCTPIYETLPGWKKTTHGLTDYRLLPEASQRYLQRIVELIETPIVLVSASDRREETIWLES